MLAQTYPQQMKVQRLILLPLTPESDIRSDLEDPTKTWNMITECYESKFEINNLLYR